MMSASHLNNELSIHRASVDTNSPEARKQFHRYPAIGIHLTTQEKILYKVLVAEVVLSDNAHKQFRQNSLIYR